MSHRVRALLLKPGTWVAPYVALWLLVGFLPIQATDLDIFFWPSAKVAVAGHPLLVYSAGGQNAYPNANGPVALLPLTAVGLVVRALGWLDSMPERRALALAAFSFFILLMAREAVAAIERLRGAALGAYPRLFAFAMLTLGPPVWQSVLGYGHIEQPIEIWLALMAARRLDRAQYLRAGVTFGLAVLTRSSAVLLAVPFGLAAVRRGPRAAALLLAATAATGVAVLAPFFVADRSDLTHSLFTYRGGLQVGAGSIWSVARGSGIEAVIQHWDVALIASAVLAANLWLVARPGGLEGSRLYAGMTLTSATFALLAKTVWPYYFFEVFVFGTVWAAGRWSTGDGVIRLGLAPLAIAAFGLLAEIGSAQDMPRSLVELEGASMFVMLVLTAGWIIWMAGRPRADRPGMAAGQAAFQEHGLERADERARPR